MKGLSFDDLVLRAMAVDDDDADPALNELGREGSPRVEQGLA